MADDPSLMTDKDRTDLARLMLSMTQPPSATPFTVLMAQDPELIHMLSVNHATGLHKSPNPKCPICALGEGSHG